MRLLPPVLACLAMAALALPGVASADEGPRITASPALQPPFDPAVGQYVTRCDGGPVRLDVTGAPTFAVGVDGDAPRAGSFTSSAPLAAGQRLRLSVTQFQEDVIGTREYDVRCLPPDFPAFTAARTGTTQAGWYIATPSLSFSAPPAGVATDYVSVFNRDGAPVWWTRSPDLPADAKLLPNGHIAWNLLSGGFREVDLNGTVARSLNTVGFPSDVHEALLLPNGNYLLMAYVSRSGFDLSSIGGPANASIVDNEVQEITPAGALVWSWRASDHIPFTEVPVRWRSTALGPGMFGTNDVYHLNSIEPDGDGYLLSFRVLDAVYRIDRATGSVDYKLGGTPVAGKSLTVVDDPRNGPDGPIAGQHDARLLPGGDLTLFDNGAIPDGSGGWAGLPPRAVRYAIDKTARTATLKAQVTDPNVPQSLCCGSSRRLPGGNWVTAWGGTSTVTEATPAGTRVFSLAFGAPLFSYRADPVLPGALSPSALEAGMNARHPRASVVLSGETRGHGTVPVGSRVTHEINVLNWDTVPVRVSGVEVQGADAAQYAPDAANCAGRTLAPRENCQFTVTYAPAALGEHRDATAHLVSDAASSPNSVPLSGEAVDPPPPPPSPAPTPVPPPSPRSAPSNEFVFPALRVDARGTVRATIKLPGAGRLEALETARTRAARASALRPARGTTTIGRTVRTMRRAGRLAIAVRLNRTGRRLMKARHGRLRARLTLRFTPAGGSPRTGWRAVTIRTRPG